MGGDVLLLNPFTKTCPPEKCLEEEWEKRGIGLGPEKRKGGGSVRVLGRGCGHVLDHWIMLLSALPCLPSWNTLPSTVRYVTMGGYWILWDNTFQWVDFPRQYFDLVWTPGGCPGIILTRPRQKRKVL